MWKLSNVLCGLVFAGVSVLVTTQVLSDDLGKGPSDDEAKWAKMMKYGQPGKYHEHLKPLAGKWDAVVRMRETPDAPWVESTSVAEYKWIMGGRFLLQTVHGDAGGMPFEGMGIIGYDNFTEEYVTMWLDTMGTGMLTGTGTCDASGKTLTFSGVYANPMSGNKKEKFKSVTRVVNNDKVLDEWWVPGPDGKEFQALEITSTRK